MDTNHKAQGDGDGRPRFPDHAAEISYLSALCTCGHKRGDHVVNNGTCQAYGGCNCHGFTYSPGKNFEAHMRAGGTTRDGYARND